MQLAAAAAADAAATRGRKVACGAADADQRQREARRAIQNERQHEARPYRDHREATACPATNVAESAIRLEAALCHRESKTDVAKPDVAVSIARFSAPNILVNEIPPITVTVTVTVTVT